MFRYIKVVLEKERKKGKKAGLKAGLINNVNYRNFGKNEKIGFWKILDFWTNWKNGLLLLLLLLFTTTKNITY